jgi:hypothetical protein
VRDAYLDGWDDVGDRATLDPIADAAIALSGLNRWEAWWRLMHRAPIDTLEEHRPYVQALLATLGDADASITLG